MHTHDKLGDVFNNPQGEIALTKQLGVKVGTDILLWLTLGLTAIYEAEAPE